MTQEERAALLAKAEKATPGPWDTSCGPSAVSDIFEEGDFNIYPPLGQFGPVAIGAGAHNAAFIAAADPTTVKALLAALDAAREECLRTGRLLNADLQHQMAERDEARAELAAAQAEIARLREALERYGERYCEGWCHDGGAGCFTDCGGCEAWAALASPGAGDGA
ncbi:ead/Ea22-like family protein [Falsiroseomonas tokyonensis]|uniref:Ead/Ea22-like family protein n=1 Tax=Falsiroseomonas tokyonensis TaxID=430521 RepID=A0ABV7C1Q3_9PROT|nr:ead/Ea22-like family protein [Falsiroseomonas tokyonensis]MBU8540854.1 hypothetical protein [Falsiroseomonas tokyonensis]